MGVLHLVMYFISVMKYCNAIEYCTFNGKGLLVSPVGCCVIKEDVLKLQPENEFEFPMKIFYNGTESSEVTRILSSDEEIDYYFHSLRFIQHDILKTYLHMDKKVQEFSNPKSCLSSAQSESLLGRYRRLLVGTTLTNSSACEHNVIGYKICQRTNDSLSLKSLPIQSAKKLSNCGTDIYLEKAQLESNIEYLKFCECAEEFRMSLPKLKELYLILPFFSCRKPVSTETCTETSFHCKNSSRCFLSTPYRCNGKDDCGDGSDEDGCENDDYCTEGGRFRCESDGICKVLSTLCNGKVGCKDGSDEKDCADIDRCTSRGLFRCHSNGYCRPNKNVCDGYAHCSDSSDEANCTSKDYCTENGRFKCDSDGICKLLTSLCNNHPDCKDGSDENDCADSDRCSSYGLFRCDNGKCIPVESVCDGRIRDCHDGSDEKYCNSKDYCTPTGRHRCESGMCVPAFRLCDDINNCRDFSDEFNCRELIVHAPNLEIITTNYESFTKVSYSVQTQKSVKKLRIHSIALVTEHMHIETIMPKIAGFENLKHLNLWGKVLPSRSATLHNISMASVEHLNLSHCGITTLDYIHLEFFPSLKVLDLYNNTLKSIDPNTFFYLKNLAKLNLSKSFDQSLGGSIKIHLSTLQNMEFIDLSKNNLQNLELVLTSKVEFLDLSYNNLDYYTVKLSCTENSNVDYVSLKSNRVKLNSLLFDNLCRASLIDVEDYILDCADCESLMSRTLRNVLNNKSDVAVIFNSSHNVPVCTTPDENKGQAYKDVDLCSIRYTTDWVKTAIIVAVVVGVIFLVMIGIGYYYRFEIFYWIQYVKLKKRKLSSCQCDSDGFEYDAFISYCGADRRHVWNVLMPGLEESVEKYRLCLHERDFLLGSHIFDNIENSLKTSRYCVVILSNDFIQSQWCRFELEQASFKLVQENREFLILIELEPLDTANIPSHLKQLISTRTYLEWNTEKFSEEDLLNRLRRALGRSIFERKTEAERSTETLTSSV